METFTRYLTEIITRELFTGYGFYAIAFVIYSEFRRPSEFWFEHDLFADKLTAFFGVVYFSFFLLSTILVLVIPETEAQRRTFLNRVSGPYWFGYWLQPLVWFAFSQALRLTIIQRSKILKILVAAILISSFEIFAIAVTSYYREYNHSGTMWSATFMIELIAGSTLKTLMFLLCSITYYKLSQIKPWQRKH